MKLSIICITISQMAEDLGINSMIVNKNYAILKSEGFISRDRRHGAKVNPITGGNVEFREKLEEELNLGISEASLKRVNKEEFMNMCDKIFTLMKGVYLENK